MTREETIFAIEALIQQGLDLENKIFYLCQT